VIIAVGLILLLETFPDTGKVI